MYLAIREEDNPSQLHVQARSEKDGRKQKQKLLKDEGDQGPIWGLLAADDSANVANPFDFELQ